MDKNGEEKKLGVVRGKEEERKVIKNTCNKVGNCRCDNGVREESGLQVDKDCGECKERKRERRE